MYSIAARAGVFGLALLALYGCGSTRFEAEDAAKVRTVRLAGFEEPDIVLQGRFVLNTYAIDTKTGKEFNTVLTDAGLKLGAELKTAIAQTLRDDGYQVTDADDADAVFEGKIGAVPPNWAPMYEAAGAGFKPEFSLETRLKDAKTKKSLFHQFYIYRDNSISPMDGTILIRPDAKYEFGSVDELVKDSKRAADGMRAAIPPITQSLSALLKKP